MMESGQNAEYERDARLAYREAAKAAEAERYAEQHAEYVVAGNALAKALRDMESPMDHVYLSDDALVALALWAALIDGSPCPEESFE